MQLEHLMLAAILFFCASIVFVSISNRLKLGAIFGYLVAGIAIGPHSPGPMLYPDASALLGIGELGVVFLMFTIGLGIRPHALWEMRRFLLGLGPLQVAGSGAAIAAALLAITGLSINAAIVLGLGLAMSSTAIVMQVLAAKGDVATEYGRATFAVLVLQDLASVVLLVMIPFLALGTAPASGRPYWEQGLLAAAAIAAIVLAGRFVLPPLFMWSARQQSTTNLGAIALVAVMITGIAMSQVGLSMPMGAFLLGVVLSASDFRHQLRASISRLQSVFLALFFVAVGMSIDLDAASAAGPAILFYTLVVVVLKVAVTAGLGMAFGLDRSQAVRTAFLLAPCSEFGFVVFAAARSGDLLSDHGFAISAVVVSLSMALTPFLVNIGFRLGDLVKPKKPTPDFSLKHVSEELKDHVVVAGYSRTGRLMCLMLEQSNTPYIAFDLNPSRILSGKSEGHAVYFGDVTDPEMAGAAAFASAKSVVVTLEDMRTAEFLVEELRNFYPHLAIQVAVPDLPTQTLMRDKGAAEVICTPVEGALLLGEAMLSAAGVATPDIESLVETLRNDDYKLIRDARIPGTITGSIDR